MMMLRRLVMRAVVRRPARFRRIGNWLHGRLGRNLLGRGRASERGGGRHGRYSREFHPSLPESDLERISSHNRSSAVLKPIGQRLVKRLSQCDQKALTWNAAGREPMPRLT